MGSGIGTFLPSPYSSQQIELRVKLLVEEIRKISEPDAIFLFGSAASGTMTRDSDIDMAVLFASEENLRNASKRIYDAGLSQGEPVCEFLFLLTKKYLEKSKIGGVCFDIRQTGKCLFSKIDLQETA